MLQWLRDFHDRPLQLREGVRRCLEQPLRSRYDVMVNSHQFIVAVNHSPSVVIDRIVEQAHILQIGLGDGGRGELVVMQVQDLELRECGELEWDIGELVGREV